MQGAANTSSEAGLDVDGARTAGEILETLRMLEQSVTSVKEWSRGSRDQLQQELCALQVVVQQQGTDNQRLRAGLAHHRARLAIAEEALNACHSHLKSVDDQLIRSILDVRGTTTSELVNGAESDGPYIS